MPSYRGQGARALCAIGLLWAAAGLLSASAQTADVEEPLVISRKTRDLLQAASADGPLLSGFVARSGTRFVVQAENGTKDECETFYFAGANAYYLMIRAADPETRPQVLEILDSAQRNGLKVLRMWAFNDGPLQYNALQRYPGVYDEKVLVGLDFVLHQMSLRGLRSVLVLANYWGMYGGIDQYNVWSFEAGSGTCKGDVMCRDNFYSDPVAVGYYKDHVKKLLTRVNTFNGRLYREDPAIFGYNLMNEPRSQALLYVINRTTTDTNKLYNISYNSGDDLQKWIEDMAGYVKSIDPIHLLSTGQEGFAGNSTPLYMYSNPGAWASLMGVDFVRNNRAKGIDYATMHVYVDQWLCVAQGSTTPGQLSFLKDWVEARQQAAEEELEMPMVLEEFGCKLDKRAGQYGTAYDTCLKSAQRGGSCAGVMFWDLTHKDYKDLDPYLDGLLRFGGGYSNWDPPANDEMGRVMAMARNYSAAVTAINKKSHGKDTCVFVPPPQRGLGCKDLAVNFDEGGMPWTCLPGEPANENFCTPPANAAALYKNPPVSWRGANNHGLPYNSIEVLVLGNLTNTGSQPINLKDSWIIIPFSMGLHTQFEGIWKREHDPNNYFKVYCWYMGTSGYGNLCDNGVQLGFTNFTWPEGVKRDRGFNITFTKDIILQPQASISGYSGDSGNSNIVISFKDTKNNYRLDVSSLGLKGSSNCPASPVYSSYPPPPPPLPKACAVGPDPRRGCPNLEWYWSNTSTGQNTPTGQITTNSIPGVTMQTAGAGRHLLQASAPGPAPNSAVNASGGPILKQLYSGTSKVSLTNITLARNMQWVFSAKVTLYGLVKKQVLEFSSTDKAGTPHPDASGGSKATSIDTMVTLVYKRQGLSNPTYLVLAKGLVVPGNSTHPANETMLRGVFQLHDHDDLTDAYIVAEAVQPGMDIKIMEPKFYTAKDLSDPSRIPALPTNLTDPYSPCVVDDDHGNTGLFEVVMDKGQNDTLQIEMCAKGGYDQVMRVYANGKEVARSDPNGIKDRVYKLAVPMSADKRYIIAVHGDTGSPYGGYRGFPGVRLIWGSRTPYAAMYDGAPTQTNASEFVRVDNGDLVIGCKKAAYVGVNTWDLMDKASYGGDRSEIIHRLDSMVQAGWKVGRTWGFSLGTGLSNGPLGKTIADPTKILEYAPGQYNENVFASLDWVLAEAAKRDIKLIIPIEDYWLSMDRFVNWSSTAVGKNDFYTDKSCRQMYKHHLRTFTSRKNTINGRIYREDPTIFYWDLMNEPRCTGCGFALQQWVEEMSVYMKAIDPNHLVTIGAEGFYSSTCERAFLNPGAGKRRTGIASSPWAAQEGQDFLANHVVPSIDIATTHIWADNWMGYADYAGPNINDGFDYTHGKDLWKEKLDYTKAWMAAHISDANALGKPLIIEEFGKAISAAKVYTGELPHSLEPGETIEKGLYIRNQFLQAVYDAVQEDALKGGPTQGTNFWNLYTVGTGADDPYQITLADTSTMDIVNAHAKNISSIRGKAAAGTCKVDGSGPNTKLAPFPGYAAGTWTPPEKDEADLIPLTASQVVASSNSSYSPAPASSQSSSSGTAGR